jgi:hypothetical protein
MPNDAGKLTPSEMRQFRALIRAQAAIRDQLSETAAEAVARAFAAIDNYWDTDQTKRAVEQSVKIVQSQQRRMAQVTDGYMAQSTSLVTGRRYRPVGAVNVTRLRRQLPQSIVDNLAHADTSPEGVGPALTDREQANIERAKNAITNVEPGQVYGRLADAYRYRVATGLMNEEKAARYVEHRARGMADTDIMLADRAQSQRFMTERKPSGVRGYRRVLHPELEGGGPPCGLCVVAADRVYRFEDLMPIHARCRCTVAAVGSKDDPGFKLNEQDIKRVYEQAGQIANKDGTPRADTSRKRLLQIRVDVEVVEHGELGPWLVNPKQRFRGPREVAKTQTTDPFEREMAQIEAIHDELESLYGQRGSGMDVDEAINWRKTKLQQLNARIPAA